MAPDLPEKLLGIDINDDGSQRESDDADDEPDEEHVRVVRFRVGEHRLAVPVDDVRTTTDLPEEVTPVPRTPEAIEGVTDLRGEITAVIDPTVHFPTDETAGDRDQLLIFDRPGDRQSAAIRVDGIDQVESVPESDVLDADDEVAARDLSTDALEHPLVTALLVQEYHRRRDATEVSSAAAADDQEPTLETDSESGSEADIEAEFGIAAETGIDELESERDDGAEFDAADGSSATAAETEAEIEPAEGDESTAVVDVTPLIDIDRWLLAAGPTERAR